MLNARQSMPETHTACFELEKIHYMSVGIFNFVATFVSIPISFQGVIWSRYNASIVITSKCLICRNIRTCHVCMNILYMYVYIITCTCKNLLTTPIPTHTQLHPNLNKITHTTQNTTNRSKKVCATKPVVYWINQCIKLLRRRRALTEECAVVRLWRRRWRRPARRSAVLAAAHRAVESLVTRRRRHVHRSHQRAVVLSQTKHSVSTRACTTCDWWWVGEVGRGRGVTVSKLWYQNVHFYGTARLRRV